MRRFLNIDIERMEDKYGLDDRNDIEGSLSARQENFTQGAVASPDLVLLLLIILLDSYSLVVGICGQCSFPAPDRTNRKARVAGTESYAGVVL